MASARWHSRFQFRPPMWFVHFVPQQLSTPNRKFFAVDPTIELRWRCRCKERERESEVPNLDGRALIVTISANVVELDSGPVAWLVMPDIAGTSLAETRDRLFQVLNAGVLSFFISYFIFTQYWTGELERKKNRTIETTRYSIRSRQSTFPIPGQCA